MFWHNYKYALKTLLKSKSLVFWTLAFPFILAILFNLAFARLHDYDTFEPFEIAVVKNDEFNNNIAFKTAFNSLSQDGGDEQLFETKYVDMDEAEKLLDDDKIEGFVYIADSQPHVKIKTNGTNQTVLKTVTEQISQTATIINEVAKSEAERKTGQNVAQIYLNAMKIVSEAEPNIKDESRVMNMVAIEFYSLIAMACMQGAMLSVELTNRCLPNLSNRGKRVAIAPTRKSTTLSSGLAAGYTMLLFSLCALILFMRLVLGVEFGGNIGLIVLLAAAGSLSAMMLGMLLSVALKTNEGAKNIIVVIVAMVGSLFAGMFGGMKIYFDNLLPFVNKISPVGLITDGYYSLYYYNDLGRYFVNLGSLLVISAIFFILATRSLRRSRYDSI